MSDAGLVMRLVRGIGLRMAVCMWIAALPATAPAADDTALSVVGSSTVFPFVSAAVEAFRADNPGVVVDVESTGTGGGMRFFCAGAGEGFPDIANASRPMTPEEQQACAKNGVERVVPLRLGYDGITLVAPHRIALAGLRSVDLYRAIAAQIPTENGFEANPAQYWDEVNPALPHTPILVLGPPKTSGTRDFMESNFMVTNCRKLLNVYRTPASPDDISRLCKLVRADSGYIDAGEDDSFLIEKVVESEGIVGLVGFGHAQAHANEIRVLPVDNHYPSSLTIRHKLYPLARPLFVYFKGEHMQRNPALRGLAAYIGSEAVMAPDGLLSRLGLVIPADGVRDENRRNIGAMAGLKCPSDACESLR
jgi:phosphate transport system substrate-binding protein